LSSLDFQLAVLEGMLVRVQDARCGIEVTALIDQVGDYRLFGLLSLVLSRVCRCPSTMLAGPVRAIPEALAARRTGAGEATASDEANSVFNEVAVLIKGAALRLDHVKGLARILIEDAMAAIDLLRGNVGDVESSGHVVNSS